MGIPWWYNSGYGRVEILWRMGREFNTSSNARQRSERGDPWEGVNRNPLDDPMRERTAALGPVAALGEHHGALALPEHGPRRAPLGGASGDGMAKRCGRLRKGKGGGHPNKRRHVGSPGLRGGGKHFWPTSTHSIPIESLQPQCLNRRNRGGGAASLGWMKDSWLAPGCWADHPTPLSRGSSARRKVLREIPPDMRGSGMGHTPRNPSSGSIKKTGLVGSNDPWGMWGRTRPPRGARARPSPC